MGDIIKVAKGLAVPATATITGGIVSAAGAANLLPALGFGAAGIKAASAAAFIQSSMFGAAVPAGSWFAAATSWGATGCMAAPMAAVAGPVGAVAAGVSWYYFKR